MEKSRNESPYEKASMRVLLQTIVEEELAEFDAWNQMEHEYTPEINHTLTGIFRKDRLKRNFRIAVECGRKAAVGFAVFVLLALIACASIEPIREKIADAIVTWYEGRNAVVFEAADEIREPMLPTCIPEGYEAVYYEVNDELAVIEYSNGHNSYAFMRTKNNENKAILFDNEHHAAEEIAFGDGKAIYIKPDKPEDRYTLMWEKDGYVYVIDSDISKEAMFDFAEGIK